jgi:hypothetical protein
VINNTITNEEVTNISGNGNANGYQAGILDVGVNDKLINNKIDGAGYSTCPVPYTCVAIDTTTASGAKVHANVTP